jgi:hypothetical protein
MVDKKILNIVFTPESTYFFFFCFTPHNSSSAELGQNSRASTSISRIAKMHSSSLILLRLLMVSFEPQSIILPFL